MKSFRNGCPRNVALAVAVAAGALLPVTLLRADATCIVKGTVKDMDEQPLEGVEVQLLALGRLSKPVTVMTHKDGTFKFPFLTWNKEMYKAAFIKAGYKVRKIHIVSRQPQSAHDLEAGGLLIQDDSGNIGADQKIPNVNPKPGGTAKIEVNMATDEFFAQLTAQKAAAGAAPSGAPGAAPEAVTPAPPAGGGNPIQAAQQLASEGKLDEATGILKESIEKEPTAEKWFELGKVREKADDSPGAMAAYGRAAGLDPKIRGAHFMLGKLYAEEGKTAEAVAEVRKELELGPDDANTLRALAALQSQAGQTDEAIRIYERLTAIPEPDPVLLARLAGLYAEKKNFAKSEQIYRRIAESNPKDADVTYYKIGLSIKNQSSFGEDERKRAAEAFRHAIEANPKHAGAHLELAYVLLGQGEIEEAKSHMQKFLDLAPQDPRAKEVRQQLKDLS